jgi:hypothetical protein
MLLYKNIAKNFQLNDLIRIEAVRKISNFHKKCNLTKQTNVCLNTGRIGGVFSK